jgi:hypothetical protein
MVAYLTNVQDAVFYPLLGILDILIPDKYCNILRKKKVFIQMKLFWHNYQLPITHHQIKCL